MQGRGRELGATVIEILVALAILGLVAGVVASALRSNGSALGAALPWAP